VKGRVERLSTLSRGALVFHPLSVWWGLKASADGKSLTSPTSGHALRQIFAYEAPSAVLDMDEMR